LMKVVELAENDRNYGNLQANEPGGCSDIFFERDHLRDRPLAENNPIQLTGLAA
jgi:hypothetical protein